MPDDTPIFGGVVTPTPGVDPRIALATSMQAAPGVYAVLVGSGMSSAANIRTGWQVVQDLIRKVARAGRIDEEELGDTPEKWWEEQRGTEARYDTLVGALASTDPARQALLREYFDPPATAGGPIQPTVGHQALAWLCATERVRVILTTNFDRLVERALDQAGVAAQVIATPQAVAGMMPLVHAQVTVVKLNGDYATLGMRNTPEELQEYPEQLRQLVAQVLDEYGLLVVGWSGDYDLALARAIENCPIRRYPTYWATLRGHITEPARRLIATRSAIEIATGGADEFLADVADRINRLGQRAARRGRATALRTYLHHLQGTAPPQGWAALPLLQLRAVAVVGPASVETCGMIRPQQRTDVVKALGAAPITGRLHLLSSTPPAPAVDADESTAHTRALGVWGPTPNAHQSAEAASYRLGGDASSGVSALVTIGLPAFVHAGALVFTIDFGLSLARSLRLAEVALLWRDGLVLTSELLPAAVRDILPADADVSRVEIHALAPSSRVQVSNQNKLAERIDLSPLGPPTREVGPSLGFAAQPPGTLSEHVAAEVVAEGIEYIALAWGYLDPQIGIDSLRRELGILA
jgi:hypothetical protein